MVKIHLKMPKQLYGLNPRLYNIPISFRQKKTHVTWLPLLSLCETLCHGLTTVNLCFHVSQMAMTWKKIGASPRDKTETSRASEVTHWAPWPRRGSGIPTPGGGGVFVDFCVVKQLKFTQKYSENKCCSIYLYICLNIYLKYSWVESSTKQDHLCLWTCGNHVKSGETAGALPDIATSATSCTTPTVPGVGSAMGKGHGAKRDRLQGPDSAGDDGSLAQKLLGPRTQHGVGTLRGKITWDNYRIDMVYPLVI